LILVQLNILLFHYFIQWIKLGDIIIKNNPDTELRK